MKRWSTSFVIREVQTKTTMRYYCIPIRMAKFQNTLTPPSFDMDVEQQQCSFVASRNGKWYRHYGIQFSDFFFFNSVISYNTKHTPTTWSTNPAHWYLPKGIENYVHLKNLHTDVYGGFTHNCQNLEPRYH